MYIAATFCLVALGGLFYSLRPAAEALRPAIISTTASAAESSKQLAVMAQAAKDLTGGLNTELARARLDLARPAIAAERAIVTFADQTRDVGSAIAAARDSLSEIQAAVHEARPAIADGAAAIARTREAADIMLDCKGHGACAPAAGLALIGSARYTLGQVARASPAAIKSFEAIETAALGTSGAIERSAMTFEAGFPRIQENAEAITLNIRRITQPHWYDQVIKGVAAGATAAAVLR